MSSVAPAGEHAVIILHGIGTPARTLEPGEDRFWLSRDRFLQVLDRIAAAGEAAPVITFDDGNASDAEIALPALAERGLSAIFFLLAGRIDTPGSLSAQDVRAIAGAGHLIGLHGHDHVDWRRLDPAGRAREWVTARERLAELAGRPVDLAAAPFGLYDRRTIQHLQAAGFGALYTSDRGRARGDAFLRPRNCLEGGMSDAALDNALNGRVPPLRALRRAFGIARKRHWPRGSLA